PAARQRRRAAGGSRNKNFTEGWVEFARKRDAKRVAVLLNGQPMGGKNRSHHRFDLWTIKYLKRFKWDNLSEEMAYRRAVREQKLEAEMRVAAKERDAYVTRVQHSKVLQRRQAKAAKKKERDGYVTTCPPVMNLTIPDPPRPSLPPLPPLSHASIPYHPLSSLLLPNYLCQAKPAAAGAEGGEGATQQQVRQPVRHYIQRGAIGEGQEQEEGRLMSRGVLGKVRGVLGKVRETGVMGLQGNVVGV
ncbi:unnamed protein product, partial [Closterium sp. NIES-64]